MLNASHLSPQKGTNLAKLSSTSSGAGQGVFAEKLAQSRDGSLPAFGELLESNRKYLLTMADRLLAGDLKRKIGASDLVQNTFIAAHRSFSLFRGATESEFVAWLTAILSKRACDVTKQYRYGEMRNIDRELNEDDLSHFPLHHLPAEIPTPGTNVVAVEETRRLQAALNTLPADTRKILLRRIRDRATFEEIGAESACSADAVRKRFLRALEEIQTLL